VYVCRELDLREETKSTEPENHELILGETKGENRRAQSKTTEHVYEVVTVWI